MVGFYEHQYISKNDTLLIRQRMIKCLRSMKTIKISKAIAITVVGECNTTMISIPVFLHSYEFNS